MKYKFLFSGWNVRFYLLLPAILTMGMLLTACSVLQTRQWMRSDLTKEALRMAQGVDIRYVLDLTGTERDLTLPAYQRLKAFLTVAGHEIAGGKSIYLLGRRLDRTIVILADSKPIESADYSPPGVIYNRTLF